MSKPVDITSGRVTGRRTMTEVAFSLSTLNLSNKERKIYKASCQTLHQLLGMATTVHNWPYHSRRYQETVDSCFALVVLHHHRQSTLAEAAFFQTSLTDKFDITNVVTAVRNMQHSRSPTACLWRAGSGNIGYVWHGNLCPKKRFK